MPERRIIHVGLIACFFCSIIEGNTTFVLQRAQREGDREMLGVL